MPSIINKKGFAVVVKDKGWKIDKGVLIGYLPGRKIQIKETKIGANARIRSGSVIYSNVNIGFDFETGHNVVVREGNIIGDSVSIWNNSVIDYGCFIGSNVKIHCNVYIAQFTKIEDDVFLAPGVVIANDPHPICTLCMEGPTIKKGARIGVNVTLLPGISIGEYSLIGAGSVVTKDVPAYSFVYGVPAKVRGNIDELECPLKIVDKPYINGSDVFYRKKEGTLKLKIPPVR